MNRSVKNLLDTLNGRFHNPELNRILYRGVQAVRENNYSDFEDNMEQIDKLLTELKKSDVFLGTSANMVYEGLKASVRNVFDDYWRTENIKKQQDKIKGGSPVEKNSTVFIVHGHNIEMREAVKAFLIQAGFSPIVLSEKASGGKTIIEKFEEYADTAGIAIVLLSADDKGGIKSKEQLKNRARQNVILELGYFMGKLGRNKVIALYEDKADIDLPSDIGGFIHIPYSYENSWKMDVGRELKQMGYNIDWENVMG